jgi:hypothetical protein
MISMKHRSGQLGRLRPHPLLVGLGLALLLVLAMPWAVAAHSPDPILGGGLFAQGQDLRFRWRAGAEPAAVIKTAIRAAATAANATRNSRSATFTYDTAGANPIGYGPGATCGVNGIACFTRTAPTSFTMWLREQGHVFDWGSLKWCQSYTSPPNGCYDAETVALDEFGHIEILNHHENYADQHDYLDAVVQTFSRVKAQAGYNARAFGRCDVATLQLQYDVPSSAAKYSTCLSLTTDLRLSWTRNVNLITLTANLAVVDLSTYFRLGGNPISARTVTLQRRPVGSTTWSSVGTMTAGGSGTYTLTYQIYAATEFRAVFSTPSGEGLRGDTSGTVSVTAFTCTGVTAVTVLAPCP